ncbi:FadR family transcriptional regulator [Frankia sp. CNm7]|uniref:FadR family transcriptional regulator n=1 Tax=Frankia nepalensis TaxID=1836974 RepID=A0A937UWH5_9ACTN|nr:GntR family transcriptional regulator [Frankia nepalensis]MBL7501968.1 FadR family transcriptional regulator [Frankia nepalensis]MBL7510598.1 FadR family transcriptional regulator [Frankia nepalensis]MBL7517338.1 FadR family transcriptional regulator [Frankia nepalensis]MBL7633421.1 FadR family transcriptional regulator [Frankia nepalensis]
MSIIRALRADIASGVIAPGSRLPTERDLAGFFGVSQPTVREAVRGLEALGLVESRHGSGVYVKSSRQDFVFNSLEVLLQMQQAHILEVFEVRRALGLYSVRLACAGATDADIDAMEAALRRASVADNLQDIGEAILDFQVAFSSAGGNALLTALETVLIRILLQIQKMAYERRAPGWWRGYTQELNAHRLRIVAALRARDHESVLKEWSDYFDAQYKRFYEDPVLSRITLNDNEAIAAVRDIAINFSG